MTLALMRQVHGPRKWPCAFNPQSEPKNPLQLVGRAHSCVLYGFLGFCEGSANMTLRVGLLTLCLLCAASVGAQTLVEDLAPGSGPGGAWFTYGPFEYLTIGSTTYFVTESPEYGWEIWKTDGTTAGTSIVIDLNPGSFETFNAGVVLLREYGGLMYFAATMPGVGHALWKTDGTAAGTVLVSQVPEFIREAVVANGKLILTCGGAGGYAQHVWCSDGTTAGTFQISVSGAFNQHGLLSGNGVAYFFASTTAAGIELWKTDGTVAGTAQVVDLNAGAADGYGGHSGLGYGTQPFATYFNGEVYFSGSDGTGGYELWKSDGTAAGTTLVLDINSGAANSSPVAFAVHAGELFFSAVGASGRELWKTDGTGTGTQIVRDIHTTGSSNPLHLTSTPLGLLFSAGETSNGGEPWISDGTTAGTTLLRDINPGSADSGPSGFVVLGTTAYFSAGNTTGNHLWATDGTTAGTTQAREPPRCSRTALDRIAVVFHWS